MEERETIPRREATIGVGLLGILTAALVGTVVFRIIHAAPPRRPAQTSAVWASHSPISAEGSLSAVEPQLAAEQLPPAAPIPTIDDGASSIPATSTTAPLPATAAPQLPSSESTRAPMDARPYFVAPSSR